MKIKQVTVFGGSGFLGQAIVRALAPQGYLVRVAARRIYQRAGFTLTDEQKHHSFGHDLVAQDWRLPLA